MKTSRRKKNSVNDSNHYILIYKTEPTKCNNCNKKKVLVYYEVKNKLWNRSEFKLLMCKDCLEELKFKLLESPSKEKQIYHDSMVNIVNDMLKEFKNVSEESRN